MVRTRALHFECYGKNFMGTVGLFPAYSQTSGNKQVSVPLNPASFTAFLIPQLRSTNCAFHCRQQTITDRIYQWKHMEEDQHAELTIPMAAL